MVQPVQNSTFVDCDDSSLAVIKPKFVLLLICTFTFNYFSFLIPLCF